MKLIAKTQYRYIVEISEDEIAESFGYSYSGTEKVKEFLKSIGNELDVSGHYKEAKEAIEAFGALTGQMERTMNAIKTLKEKLAKKMGKTIK